GAQSEAGPSPDLVVLTAATRARDRGEHDLLGSEHDHSGRGSRVAGRGAWGVGAGRARGSGVQGRRTARRGLSSASNAAGGRGAGRRPAWASASRELTDSLAQDLLEPMNPRGPRLIQPTTYRPSTSGPPGESSTRPSRCGMVAESGSNG